MLDAVMHQLGINGGEGGRGFERHAGRKLGLIDAPIIRQAERTAQFGASG
jgi:hypothetical protein